MTDGVLILVVEDEALIEDLVVSGLEDAGYAVATARSTEEEIALLEQGRRCGPGGRHRREPRAGQIDRVGRCQARALTADVPIIYMSGASGHE